MSGQPLVVWDRAEGIQVYDRWGNMWLDWSSGVLVTNAGHSHPKIRQAILDQVNHGLMHNYCFPSELRAELVEELAGVAPGGLEQGLPADHRRRGVRVRDQAGPHLGPQGRRRQEDHASSRSRTPSTAARWAPRWPAASRR